MNYKILLSGKYSLANVQVDYSPEEEQDSASQKLADKKWLKLLEDAARDGTLLYDAVLFRLNGLKKIEGQTPETVVLDIADTQYKTYASLKNEDVACKPDPIGTHIILITSDGYIPFVKRSGSVEVNKNKIFTFGGFFDRITDWRDGKPCPFSCIQRETREELGIDLDLNTIEMLAVLYDNENPHPEISFTAQIPQAKKELTRSSQDEWSNIFFIKLTQLQEWLNEENEENFTPTLFGALRIFKSQLL
jgi:8-oxo-dGTP pyrophosphatase MutT (NUDIX family)